MGFLGTFFASLLALYVGIGVPIFIGVVLSVRKVRKQNKSRKEFANDICSKLGS